MRIENVGTPWAAGAQPPIPLNSLPGIPDPELVERMLAAPTLFSLA